MTKTVLKSALNIMECLPQYAIWIWFDLPGFGQFIEIPRRDIALGFHRSNWDITYCSQLMEY